MRNSGCAVVASVALAMMSAGFAAAQDASAQKALTLELNALQPSTQGCRLIFLVNNATGTDLQKAGFEMALFNENGVVDRLTVLEFNDLAAGKTKVSRFDLTGADCAKVSRVLINSVTTCEGQGIDAPACSRQLKTETKSKITFGT